MGKEWILAGTLDDLDLEDVMRFDHEDRTYAVYRTSGDEVYATDGLCTHQQQHLAEGIVIDEIIECPLHQGRFHIPSGKAKSPPVCLDLNTYPTKLVEGKIFLLI